MILIQSCFISDLSGYWIYYCRWLLKIKVLLDIIKEAKPLFDGRLKWISEKWSWTLEDAMNKGFQMATGDKWLKHYQFRWFISRGYCHWEVITALRAKDIDCVYADLVLCQAVWYFKIVRHWITGNSVHFQKGKVASCTSDFCKARYIQNSGLFDFWFQIAADFGVDVTISWERTYKVILFTEPLVRMCLEETNCKNLTNIRKGIFWMFERV